MSTKHTDAPWSIHTDYYSAGKKRCEDWREIRSPAGFVVLADTFTVTRGGEAEHYSGVRISEADANLICAAPDLLAALQRLLSLESNCDHVEGHPEICPGIESIGTACHWCEGRAAIAKAEGEIQ